MTQPGQEGSSPSQPKSNAESPARLEGSERVGVGKRGSSSRARRGVRPWSEVAVYPFVSSSS